MIIGTIVIIIIVIVIVVVIVVIVVVFIVNLFIIIVVVVIIIIIIVVIVMIVLSVVSVTFSYYLTLFICYTFISRYTTLLAVSRTYYRRKTLKLIEEQERAQVNHANLLAQEMKTGIKFYSFLF
jgi:hypothetical protein